MEGQLHRKPGSHVLWYSSPCSSVKLCLLLQKSKSCYYKISFSGLGDLKTMGHAVDKRGFGTPLNRRPPPPPDGVSGQYPPRHASMTHLHHAASGEPQHDHINGPTSLGRTHLVNESAHQQFDKNNDGGRLKNSEQNSPNSTTSPPKPTTDSYLNSSSGSSSGVHSSSSPPHSLSRTSHQNYHTSDLSNSHLATPSSTYSQNIQHSNSRSSTNHEENLPRFDSLRNLTTSSADSAHPLTSSACSTTPSLHHHFHHLHHHHHRMGGSVSNLSRIGAPSVASSIVLDRSASVTGTNMGLSRAGGSVTGSMTELDDPHQTPSPSDSGVAELEAILKEKDSEISLLKESMEQSEQIISKVRYCILPRTTVSQDVQTRFSVQFAKFLSKIKGNY